MRVVVVVSAAPPWSTISRARRNIVVVLPPPPTSATTSSPAMPSASLSVTTHLSQHRRPRRLVVSREGGDRERDPSILARHAGLELRRADRRLCRARPRLGAAAGL